jgi:phenylacetate-coenzyme A ligase PaaK-like adenylate-forming protein
MSYLKIFKVDGVVSLPSILISMAEYVERNKLVDFKIRKIGYGGEHLAPAAEEYLRKILGAEIIGSATYAINDTGVVGYQCEYCTGSIHHIIEDIHIVEIVDSETYETVPEGEIGNIILTNIDRLLMPVVRYDVGDRGRIVPGKCKCGRKTRLLELLGRSDEVLIIGADNISVDAISQCVSNVMELSQKFVMYGKFKGHLDLLEIHVECNGLLNEQERLEVAEKLVETILKEKPVMAAGLASRSIARPEVIVLSPGELPVNPRTGKIKRVIEERYA